jgi:hypothetical protein
LALFCAAVAAMGMAYPAAAAGLSLAETLAKMDQAATGFKGLSANVQYVTHTEVIHEDDAQSGTILVKRPKPKDLHVKLSIDKPEPKVAVADGNKVDVYYPRSGESPTAGTGPPALAGGHDPGAGFWRHVAGVAERLFGRAGGSRDPWPARAPPSWNWFPKSPDMLAAMEEDRPVDLR